MCMLYHNGSFCSLLDDASFCAVQIDLATLLVVHLSIYELYADLVRGVFGPSLAVQAQVLWTRRGEWLGPCVL